MFYNEKEEENYNENEEKIDKYKVQERVLQDRKHLALDKFTWDQKTQTFSSSEDNLVIDFEGIHRSKIIVGNNCIINAWYDSPLTLGYGSIIIAGHNSKIKAERFSQITAEYDSTIIAGENSIVILEDGQTIRLDKNEKIRVGKCYEGYEIIKEEKYCKTCGQEIREV